MKLSVIIPYMESYPEKRDILHACLDSFIGANEIIVVENWRQGYAVPINYGLEQATGDFLLIANDDLVFDGGSLKRLYDPNAVVSPQINGRQQKFWGCCWCMPRWVYEKVGGLWEGYDISYFDDDHTFFTYAKAGIPMYCNPQVQVTTKGGQTLDKLPDRNRFFEKNKQIFTDFWKKTPEEMYKEYPI